jgi:2-methylisocitrate lyase-like PEP mutase family enzyme
MIERGATPLMVPEELKELGFQLIVWPLGPLYASAKALQEIYATLRAHGTTENVLDRLVSFDEFHSIVGLEEKYILDAKYRS